MSCNGCRILRKGCNENCMLRQSLQGISTPQAQANATLFVAKFFGRAALMSFISSVPCSQRPVLFRSLLFEACGRTVNPVHGAVGLLWTGNWHVCQAAVETVLRGGVLHAPLDFTGAAPSPDSVSASCSNIFQPFGAAGVDDLDLDLTARETNGWKVNWPTKKRRNRTQSEESEITTSESDCVYHQNDQQGNEAYKLLTLFV